MVNAKERQVPGYGHRAIRRIGPRPVRRSVFAAHVLKSLVNQWSWSRSQPAIRRVLGVFYCLQKPVHQVVFDA